MTDVRRVQPRLAAIGLATLSLTLVFLCTSLMATAVLAGGESDDFRLSEQAIILSEGWEYRWEEPAVRQSDGAAPDNPTESWRPIAYRGGLTDPPGRNGRQVLCLRLRLPSGPMQSPHLYIGAIGFAAELLLGDSLIYAYREIGREGDGLYTGPRWHLIGLQEDYAGQMLQLRIYSEQPQSIGIADLRLVSRSAFVSDLMTSEGPTLVLGCIFLVLGCIVLLLFFARRDQKIYLSFALLLLSVGMWTLSGYRLSQLFLPTTGLFFYLTLPLQYLALAFLCVFFRQLFELRRMRLISGLRNGFLILGALSLLLHFSHWLPLLAVEAVEIIYMPMMMITMLVLLIETLQAARGGSDSARAVAIGFALFAAFVVLDIFAVFADSLAWAHNTAPWGMLLFLVSLGFSMERHYFALHRQLRATASTLREEVRQKDEAGRALQSALHEVEALKNHLEAENVYLQDEIHLAHNFDEIIGRSAALQAVLAQIEQVASSDATVLILGESGTGKELLARALHKLSARGERTLVKVNCAALPAGTIESELFGHEKGAFTGAYARKIGRFELADGGSILLDEIGELPLDLQSRLLRVLQEGEFERLGSSQTIRVDARIIAATNRDLALEVERGRFREDLYYRLNVIPVISPPLRERREDIPLLVSHFVAKFNARSGKNINSLSAGLMEQFLAYDWPGNIREMENVIERAVILSPDDELRLKDKLAAAEAGKGEHPLSLQESERRHILSVLELTGWRVRGNRGAAELLDIKPTTLASRMKKLGIMRKS